MTGLTLIRTRSCPYVQRVEIALAEKGAAYETRYVDTADKPDWFTRLSPLGKVPLLNVSRPGLPDAAIFESDVIVEFIDEALPGPRLHPGDPVERAQARSWMAFGSALLPEVYAIWMARTAEDYAAARAKVEAKLAHLESALGDGPWFAGAAFGAVDVLFAPLLGKLAVFESIAAIGLLDGFPRIARWSEALAARPSVRDTTPDNQAETLIRALKLEEGHAMQAAR